LSSSSVGIPLRYVPNGVHRIRRPLFFSTFEFHQTHWTLNHNLYDKAHEIGWRSHELAILLLRERISPTRPEPQSRFTSGSRPANRRVRIGSAVFLGSGGFVRAREADCSYSSRTPVEDRKADCDGDHRPMFRNTNAARCWLCATRQDAASDGGFLSIWR
jgi:hypothetical protein